MSSRSPAGGQGLIPGFGLLPLAGRALSALPAASHRCLPGAGAVPPSGVQHGRRVGEGGSRRYVPGSSLRRRRRPPGRRMCSWPGSSRPERTRSRMCSRWTAPGRARPGGRRPTASGTTSTTRCTGSCRWWTRVGSTMPSRSRIPGEADRSVYVIEINWNGDRVESGAGTHARHVPGVVTPGRWRPFQARGCWSSCVTRRRRSRGRIRALLRRPGADRRPAPEARPDPHPREQR